jgi:hypothetical protein
LTGLAKASQVKFKPPSPQNFILSGFSNWHFGHFIFDALQVLLYKRGITQTK